MLLFAVDVKAIIAKKLMLNFSAVILDLLEVVTLTTHPCLPRPISTMSGPTTESIWVPHLVYHKEKVLFKIKTVFTVKRDLNTLHSVTFPALFFLQLKEKMVKEALCLTMQKRKTSGRRTRRYHPYTSFIPHRNS